MFQLTWPVGGKQQVYTCICILGAIFPKNNTDLDEKILRFAIDAVNKEGWLSNITLNCSIRYAAADNSFENIYKGMLEQFTLFKCFTPDHKILTDPKSSFDEKKTVWGYLNTVKSLHFSFL